MFVYLTTGRMKYRDLKGEGGVKNNPTVYPSVTVILSPVLFCGLKEEV